MTIQASIKKLMVCTSVALMPVIASAQMINQGKIVFERKVNLKKQFKNDPRVAQFLSEDVTWRIENFEMHFNDSLSSFLPVQSEEDEVKGFMKYLTTHNTIYTNQNTGKKQVVLDLWGTQTYIEDSIHTRKWKITNRKRIIAGYECRRAIWEQDDTTRIYAWFCTEIVPTIGPEGFSGLPGGILGLATENGSIIYFAQTVEEVEVSLDKLTLDTKGQEVFTEEELKATMLEKAGRWVKPEYLDAMFSWL